MSICFVGHDFGQASISSSSFSLQCNFGKDHKLWRYMACISWSGNRNSIISICCSGDKNLSGYTIRMSTPATVAMSTAGVPRRSLVVILSPISMDRPPRFIDHSNQPCDNQSTSTSTIHQASTHLNVPWINHGSWQSSQSLQFTWQGRCILPLQALQRDPWALRTKYKRMSDSHIAHWRHVKLSPDPYCENAWGMDGW